jgi:hypothetical protein
VLFANYRITLPIADTAFFIGGFKYEVRKY